MSVATQQVIEAPTGGSLAPSVQVTKTRAKDLLRQVGLGYAETAYKAGRSLSVQLEIDDPSTDYPSERSDAFGRLMRAANIRTKSAPEWGLAADECDKFFANDATRVLMTEHFARQWRAASHGKSPNTRALYANNDQPLGSVSNPYFENQTGRWDKQIAPAIPIAALVAMTTPIDRSSYKAFYLQDNAANQRMVRVGQGADIPTAKLVGGDREIPLYKYGRAIEMTYEQMRHMRIDSVAMHVQRMAVQAQVDKLATIIDVIVNGDGNAGTAATSFNLTTLGNGSSANAPTLADLLTFKAKFLNPYMLDTILAQESPAIKLQLLNTGTANIPLVLLPAGQVGSLRAINQQIASGQAYGISADAPSGKWVGIDSRMCIEQVTEIGATIQEMHRFIKNQTEILTMTETEGYAVIDANCNKILNLAA